MLDALLELLALDRLPRTGWILAGIDAPESIAGHSLGAALIALALAPRVEPPLDVDRAVVLCAVHDVPEARLGDVPRSGSGYLPDGAKAEAESAIADDLLGALSAEAATRYAEYAAGASREARFAKLCDKLHLGLRLLGYARAGARGLDEFRPGLVELDCAEFPPCAELRDALIDALRSLDR